MQALDEFVTRARSQNEVHYKTSVQSLADLHSGGCRFAKEFSGLLTRFRDELKSIEEISSLASSGLEAIGSFGESTRERLSGLRRKVESEPLKECLPTGQTPRKRKYNFPTALPSTGSSEEVLGKAKGEVVRPVLGEKEVNSPQKQPPSATSILTDPKSGGAGIGAAFYPTIANKKKVFRDVTPASGEYNDRLAENSIFQEDEGYSRRKSLRKRKVDDGPDVRGDELGLATITTRRRMR